jgi:cobalamin biosynthesis protein CobT
VPEQDITGRNIFGSVELVAADASKMGQQRQLLARALKRNEDDSYDHGRPSGRLVGRDLAKVAVRDGNIFGKRHISEGYDTDVQVLVDGSGSMGGLNIKAASTLALVVAQAAAQVGVSCTAHVFNDKGLHASTKGRAKPKANKFAYMQNQICGGTPLTENMLRVVKLQKARAAGKRKVLFMITDGGCNSGPSVLKAAAEYVEQVEGVEIANLHIGGQVMGVFRNEAAVNVHKVAATGLRQLAGLLERGV